MSQKEKWKSHGGVVGFFKKISLFFLIGFFLGALFYTVFQNSFSGLTAGFQEIADNWSGEDGGFVGNLISVLWRHGRYFGLLWLLSVSRIRLGYQIGFTLYTGVRNGFLLMFFLYARGMRGVLLYFFSLLPHCLILAPLYLFCFVWINESRPIRHKVSVTAAVIFLFLLACVMESRWNLPLMRWALTI